MCGFVGFTNGNKGINPVQVIQEMMNTIIHRGPDSGAHYTDDQVTLGFRRLKIIDLSDEANQPMFNEDGSCVLVFNGEIYNFQDLREELITKGHQFKSKTDSEVLLHGYEEYGVKILDRLRGMFAFAIWDQKKEMLFMARDIFGIKPLYYTQNTSDQSLIFGSEIKAFLKHPGFIKALNKDALKPYLTFQYSVLDETFFQGVYKLRPGHYLVYQQGKLEVAPYWELKYQQQKNSLEYYIDKINETLRESVERHRISDVKVGSFLSGGVDSSYITALLKPDKTFSIGFQDYDGIFNETNLSENLSKLLDLENHKRLINADDFFEAVPNIQYHMDEPQANLSSVPLYFLAQLAREQVTVVLSGEGADEIFGGYVWYQKSPRQASYEKLPLGIRKGIASLCRLLPENRVTSFLIKGATPVEERFIGQAKVFDEADAMRVLKPPYQSGPSTREITSKVYAKVKDQDEVTKMQYLDMHLWLPGDILLKADKMSMAHSLELRVPFLDKEVMTMASTIPGELRVNQKDTKYVLRRASEKVLPQEWADRPKVGFPVPIRYWLQQEKYYNLVKEMFLSPVTAEFFVVEELLRYLEEHYQGKKNHARYIWTVYVFLVWYHQYFVER